MTLEIERRFLVHGEGWLTHARSAQRLRQMYLAASAEGVTVRLRFEDEDQARLSLKAPADAVGLVRHEFEYAIPVVDAEVMWRLSLPSLEKTRWALDLPGGDWIVDCFTGANSPLVLAEVELSQINQKIEIPTWCGNEITGESRWANAVLANCPLQSWPLKDRQHYGLA
ncbi:CYTH domain-containing protein [Synechococcus sp. M16CYN]|uniref:CYTH domain-containing protein n=1 Tax=Synechococcus sp. M16CYN TaxID=3103139 RepID=UPI00324DA864